MRKLNSFAALGLAAVMVTGLVGCGSSSSTSESSTSSASTSASVETSSTSAAEETTSSSSTSTSSSEAVVADSTTSSTSSTDAGEVPEVTGDYETDCYAIVLKTQSSQFWQDMKTGIEEEADRLGVTVDIQSGNTEDDVEGQVTILENFLSTGKYKAIGVAPISDVNLNNTIATATEQEIQVVDIDEKIDADALADLGGALYAYVATDNEAVGEMAANELLNQIGEDGAQVAIIEGKAGALSGEQRRDGAKAAFEAAGAEIVDSQPADWDRTKAYDVATNIMNANPDLKAIYCCNDTMALGAAEAVQAAGKDVLVCGTDGDSEAIQAVADGEMAATVAQNPKEIGAKALDLMVEAVQEGSTPVAGQDFPTYGIDAILITADNASDYLE